MERFDKCSNCYLESILNHHTLLLKTWAKNKLVDSEIVFLCLSFLQLQDVLSATGVVRSLVYLKKDSAN